MDIFTDGFTTQNATKIITNDDTWTICCGNVSLCIKNETDTAECRACTVIYIIGGCALKITQVTHDKKQYLPLLLLGDEQESMIDRYLEQGDLFVLFKQDTAVAVAVVSDEGEGICELKNLAVSVSEQKKGYGKQMVDFLCEHYRDSFHAMLAGTGDSPLTIPFYCKCGFTEIRRIPDFFTLNYDHPILEEGVQLRDMVILKRTL